MNVTKIILKMWLRLYPRYRQDIWDLGRVIGALNRTIVLLPRREKEFRRLMRQLATRYAPVVA